MSPDKAATARVQITQPRIAYLLGLPMETILTVASYLPTGDTCSLRLVCKVLDGILLKVFARQHFTRLYLMPTLDTLQTLISIAESERLSRYVHELCICSSIYQHGVAHIQERPWTDPTVSRPRVIKANHCPYPCTVLPWQLAANHAADFVRFRGFQAQLTTALHRLQIRRIEIQEWPRRPTLPLGLSRLIRQTGKDPFKDVFLGIRPAWEYTTPNMVTCVTNGVLSAVLDSRTPLSSLVIDRVQGDQIKVAHRSGHSLDHLRFFKISIALSNQKLHTLLSDQNSCFDIFTLINGSPHLEHLALYSTPYTRSSGLHLNEALQCIDPRGIQKLSLGMFWDATPQLVPFLKGFDTNLRDLELIFTVSSDESKPWNDMFSKLRAVLSLEHLHIDIDAHIFDAHGNDEIEFTLTWLAESMPDHWAKLEETEEEDGSEEEQDEAEEL